MGLRFPDVPVVVDAAAHPSLHPVVGAPDGRGAPGADQAVSRTRRALRFIRIWSNRIEHSWVGDLIGVVSIFGSLWLGLLLAHAMSGAAP